MVAARIEPKTIWSRGGRVKLASRPSQQMSIDRTLVQLPIPRDDKDNIKFLP